MGKLPTGVRVVDVVVQVRTPVRDAGVWPRTKPLYVAVSAGLAACSTLGLVVGRDGQWRFVHGQHTIDACHGVIT